MIEKDDFEMPMKTERYIEMLEKQIAELKTENEKLKEVNQKQRDIMNSCGLILDEELLSTEKDVSHTNQQDSTDESVVSVVRPSEIEKEVSKE